MRFQPLRCPARMLASAMLTGLDLPSQRVEMRCEHRRWHGGPHRYANVKAVTLALQSGAVLTGYTFTTPPNDVE